MSMMCFNFSAGSNEPVCTNESTSVAESSEADKTSSKNLRTNEINLCHVISSTSIKTFFLHFVMLVSMESNQN